METTEGKKLDTYALVEIMGHHRYAGRITEEVIAGAAMLRIDVPEVDATPAFTKYFGAQSIYAITPTTEELARAMAGRLRAEPVSVYGLGLVPAEPKALGAGSQDTDDWESQDDDDWQP